MSLTEPRPSDTAFEAASTGGLLKALTDGAVVAKRNLIKIKRVPDLLVFSTISPIMFILLFGYIFGTEAGDLMPDVVGVAIQADADNTKAHGVAYFSDMDLRGSPPAAAKPSGQ